MAKECGTFPKTPHICWILYPTLVVVVVVVVVVVDVVVVVVNDFVDVAVVADVIAGVVDI